MIDEHPDGADLLESARALFESRLLPELKKDQRHAGRMIMRAMDLAMREMRAGVKPLADEMASLDALFGSMTTADGAKATVALHAARRAAAGHGAERVDHHVDDVVERLELLNRRLIDDIRSGRLDPGTPSHDAAFAHLRSVARERLRRSNPKLLMNSSTDSR